MVGGLKIMYYPILLFIALGFGLTIGLPVFLSFGIATYVHILDVGSRVWIIFMQRVFAGATNYSFIAVPLFMLAGKVMEKTGITKRLIDFCNSFVGHWRGGLAHVNIVTSIFFAGISGSALADTAMLGSILIPAMEDEGYEKGFAGAVTAASATIGPIIPPSIVMVVYGSAFGISIGALFAAGILPGIVLGLSQIIITIYLSKKRNYPVSTSHFSILSFLKSFWNAIPALLMPLIILGGIFSGIFTATESSAIAALYALLLGSIKYRALTIKKLYNLFREVALTVSGIMIILAVAQNYAWILTRRRIPGLVAEQVTQLTQNPIILLIIMLTVLLIAGMFIERTVNLFIFTPLFLPLMTEELIGFSTLHASFIIIFILGVGHITPPFGGTLYVASMVGDVKLNEIIKFMFPFILGMLIVTILIVIFPSIVTYIPSLLGYM